MNLARQAHAMDIPVFVKEDLITVMVAERMIQELPREFFRALETQYK